MGVFFFVGGGSDMDLPPPGTGGFLEVECDFVFAVLRRSVPPLLKVADDVLCRLNFR